MERSEVSAHEVRVYLLLSGNPTLWLTNAEVATRAGVAPRTARLHTLRLVQLGMLDQAEVFPAHRYRWSGRAAKRNRAYLQRLGAARDALGDIANLP